MSASPLVFAGSLHPRPGSLRIQENADQMRLQMLLLTGNLMRFIVSPEGEDVRLGLAGFLGGLAMAFGIGLELL